MHGGGCRWPTGLRRPATTPEPPGRGRKRQRCLIQTPAALPSCTLSAPGKGPKGCRQLLAPSLQLHPNRPDAAASGAPLREDLPAASLPDCLLFVGVWWCGRRTTSRRPRATAPEPPGHSHRDAAADAEPRPLPSCALLWLPGGGRKPTGSRREAAPDPPGSSYAHSNQCRPLAATGALRNRSFIFIFPSASSPPPPDHQTGSPGRRGGRCGQRGGCGERAVEVPTMHGGRAGAGPNRRARHPHFNQGKMGPTAGCSSQPP